MLKNLGEFLKSIGYCLHIAWKASKGYTLLRLAGNFLLPLTSIIASYFLKLILDLLAPSGASPEAALSQVIFLLLASLAVALASRFLQRFTQHANVIHNAMIENQISLSILDQAMSADLSLYDDARFYDQFSAVRSDSYSLSSVLWSVLDCISAVFSLASAFAILARYNFWYALLITLLIIPTTVANQYYTRKLYWNDLAQTNNSRKKDYIFQIGSMRQYAQEVRCWDLGGFLKEKYLGLWNLILQAKKKLSFQQTVVVFLLSILPEAAVCGLSIRIAAQALGGALSVGDYTFYTGMMSQILASTMLFVTHMIAVYDNKLKLEHMRSFNLDYCRKIVSGTQPIDRVESISFRDVCFQYPGTEKRVLDHVSFTIEGKETVVLAGKNGSGKSTLIKLLLRLYDPTSGKVLVNGRDIREYRIEDLHRCFGVYFQNAPNFSFTLRENIVLNRQKDGGTDSQIKALFSACDGEDLLAACHGDLDTYLTRIFSEDGIELSEGQHQKVAIVRALYGDASCLVLDEPSSALDPEAESRIFDHLYQEAKEKLALLTSHRLSNIYLADRIILMEQGRILEDGSRRELLSRKDGRFAELYEYQAQKFRDGDAEKPPEGEGI